MDFEKVIAYAEEKDASDVHFSVDMPVFIRINKQMMPMGEEKLKVEDIEALADKLLHERQKQILKERRQVDFLAVMKSGLRLRGNAFYQQYGLSISFRVIPKKIRELSEIGFPQFLYDRVMKTQQGLILVVGPTGQGKTTTLASILQERMRNKTEHIITIEDPIEYVLPSGKGIVQQREVGRDVIDFTFGIESSLREDPDVLMVGEMRNLETISSALTMAETGHTVFSTLHTNDGPQTITRIIDVFPADKQDQIRSQLATTLKLIVSQRLVPTTDGEGLVLAYEVLTSNYAIQNYIRQNKIFQIPNVLQTDSSGYMVQFEQSLAGLVIEGTISKDIALEYSEDPEQLSAILTANGYKSE